MTPYYEDGSVTIYRADCRDAIPNLEAVDAVVTDPPYGLSFMGKGWDHGVPGVEFWKVVRSAMKPGAHLLAFGGTRTHHRLMCAIEDAGFEIRDVVMWVYGSGFPKSLDVSKAIDKAAGVERKVIGQRTDGRYAHDFRKQNNPLGQIDPRDKNVGKIGQITSSATDDARRWEGWGTALKPAWEPIIVARKPIEEGTVAANVLEYGTGAMNIDECRVTLSENEDVGKLNARSGGRRGFPTQYVGGDNEKRPFLPEADFSKGRWPANLIHDGSDEVLELFPASTARPAKEILKGGVSGSGVKSKSNCYAGGRLYEARTGYDDKDESTARFFYCAKASGTNRGDETLSALPLFGVPEETFRNDHPTVKPVELMEYLLRLVVPPGGVVLDPFMGSGSTLVAAKALGFRSVGIELEERSCEIAVRRVSAGKSLERAR